MSKKEELKKVKDKIEGMSVDNQPKGLGDLIDFSRLFRVKGTEGLWFPVQINKKGSIHIHKMGMVLFGSFEHDGTKRMVKKENIVPIMKYYFYTLDHNKTVTIQEVFNNLNTHFIDVDIDSSKHFDKLMSLMVPNYDPDKFKDYHARLILGWYKVIKNKIINIEKKHHVESL